MKLSPVSIPYRAFQKASSLLIAAFFVVAAGTGGDVAGIPVVVPLAVGAILLAVGYEIAYYRRFEYEFTDDTFDIRSGVISRREREIPYRRIQNVDISRNVLQRLLGIAAVSLETAGGSSTEGSIRYVSPAEAKRLQSELQRRKRRVESDEPGVDDADPEPVEETELYSITPTELGLVGALSFDPRLLGLALFVASGSFPLLQQFLPQPEALLLSVTGLLVVAGLFVASWLLGVAIAVTNYYGFRLTRSGDEFRYERGLLRRFSGSIPSEKVQSITVQDNPLKRTFGYATLVIETAGYAPGGGGEGRGQQVAVPIARTDRIYRLANEVEEFGTPEFHQPPGRTRRRYAFRYSIGIGVLTAIAYGVDRYLGFDVPWLYVLALLVFVPAAAHLKWKHRGYWLGEDHLLTRNGFWRREIKAVPYYRIQNVIDTRTIFQRRWNIATVHADTAGTLSLTGSGAAAVDYDDGDADWLREELTDRLQDALQERREPQSRFEWIDLDSAGETFDRDEPSSREPT
ncbi:membrane protein [Halalkaliarchaeum desulfuricum]|uniref:Membrane protein n=1 Tax=Halalkaliarchaeum desulfuricum TaxID=2055893 RepID=A0A343TNR8_9EURY|nr:membrane protein [Halalkaliarchaeum desulfuricum]